MIKAPFNFVPLSDKVYFPDWAEQISHDVPFEDGEDGVITLKITNTTPMFVRDGHPQGKNTDLPCHVLDSQGNRVFFIPGTTLKGCFRSVFEILSFSKINRFNNSSFGYREFTSQIKGVKYPDDMKRVKSCGWLYYDGENYKIDECKQGIQKITHSKIKEYFPNFTKGEDHETAEVKQKSLGKELYPIVEVRYGDVKYNENNNTKVVPEGKYQLVCTGFMKDKKVEYLFSCNTQTISVDKEVFEAFDTVHKVTPYYAGKNGKNGFLKGLLKNGEKIPVFFEKRNDGKVVAMGITRMFKYPFKNSIKDCIGRVSEKHFAEDIDLSEAVFGFISGDKQLKGKGRVQIGNAFIDGYISDEELAEERFVLSSPKASYYPLYLNQKNGMISNYSSEDVIIAGRKRYRVTNGGVTLTQGEWNGNDDVLSTIRPIPRGHTFTCQVRIHNLRKVELGALLSSFTFNKTEGVYHNLGAAKSFGYGAFRCEVNLSEDFKYDEDEYIRSFNEEISSFLQKNGSNLGREDCLNRLVEIASATHSAEDMQQMDFDECARYKEDANFSVLTEETKNFSFGINELEARNRVGASKMLSEIKKSLFLPYNEALVELDKLRIKAIEMNMEGVKRQVELEISKLKEDEQNRKEIDLKNRLERCLSLQFDECKHVYGEIKTEFDGTKHPSLEILLSNVESNLKQKFQRKVDDCPMSQDEAKVYLLDLKNTAKELGFSDVIEKIDAKEKTIRDAQKLGAGFSFLLDRKENKDELKILDFSNGYKRCVDFLKRYENYDIKEADKVHFSSWLKEILVVQPKNFKEKNLIDWESKDWKTISKWFGADLAKQWFEQIVKK